MDASVPHTPAGVASLKTRRSILGRKVACAAPVHVPSKRGDLAVINELAAELPVTDGERQLVLAYLRDLIREILLDPE
jgi:hypothetical protein